MKNIFKFKKEKESKEEKNKPVSEEKSQREMIFYGIMFAIIMIIALIMRFTSSDNEKNNNDNQDISSTTNKEENLLESLEKNNFDTDLTIIADTDLLNLLIRRENKTKELISKTYRGESQIYYKDGDKIYKILNNQFVIDDNPNIYNNYDVTFLNIDNINKLIDKHTYELDLKEEDYNIKRYKIEASRVIDIYNEYNFLSIKKRVSGEVILDIYYTDDTLVGIKMDLTNLYENLNSNYRKVTYTYEFDNFNEIDIDSLIEVPAE